MNKGKVTRKGSLVDRQNEYIKVLNDKAEEARQTITTKGSGQVMTYEAKYLEAIKGDGPFLRAEAKALGTTVQAVAQSVLRAREKWEKEGAVIEAVRLKAKKEIKAATSTLEMSRIAAKVNFFSNQ